MEIYDRILIKPGSAYVDDFRYSLDPLVQEAWNTRIKDYLAEYPKDRNELTDLVANDPDYVLYDNFYSSRTYDAYRRCKIIDVPEIYDQKVFAYGFQKNSPFLPIFNFHLKVRGVFYQPNFKVRSSVIMAGYDFDPRNYE